MNDEVQVLIQTLLGIIKELATGGREQPKCGCGCKCGCPTDDTFESTAARFNEQAAFASSQSQQNFVAQQNAQVAQLLRLQADVTRTPAS